jgi:hypothetical protein
MKKALTVAMSLFALTGCASLDCGSDWYATGQRDGRLGADSQVENYAGRCGGNVDRARYAEGWESGWAMRPRVSSF